MWHVAFVAGRLTSQCHRITWEILPGFPSDFSKAARQNPEQKAWVRGYQIHSLPHTRQSTSAMFSSTKQLQIFFTLVITNYYQLENSPTPPISNNYLHNEIYLCHKNTLWNIKSTIINPVYKIVSKNTFDNYKHRIWTSQPGPPRGFGGT